MIERTEDPSFALEARSVVSVVRQLRRQNLDRYVTTDLRVACAVDLAHPTGAQLIEDFVVADDAHGQPEAI